MKCVDKRQFSPVYSVRLWCGKSEFSFYPSRPQFTVFYFVTNLKMISAFFSLMLAINALFFYADFIFCFLFFSLFCSISNCLVIKYFVSRLSGAALCALWSLEENKVFYLLNSSSFLRAFFSVCHHQQNLIKYNEKSFDSGFLSNFNATNLIRLLLFYVNSKEEKKREKKKKQSWVNGPFSIYDDEETAKRWKILHNVSLKFFEWVH